MPGSPRRNGSRRPKLDRVLAEDATHPATAGDAPGGLRVGLREPRGDLRRVLAAEVGVVVVDPPQEPVPYGAVVESVNVRVLA